MVVGADGEVFWVTSRISLEINFCHHSSVLWFLDLGIDKPEQNGLISLPKDKIQAGCLWRNRIE